MCVHGSRNYQEKGKPKKQVAWSFSQVQKSSSELFREKDQKDVTREAIEHVR